jgi:hypothetical protein
MQGAMKTPMLENDGFVKEEEGRANIGIFTVDPEHPVYRDPFYENDSTVLASFPFNHSNLNKSLCWHWTIVIISLGALSLYFFLLVGWPMIFFLSVILFLNGQTLWKILSTQHQRRCMHIAIATTSIYLDEVTAPGSRTLKNRQIFTYEEYQQCYVQRLFTGDDYNILEYKVMLKKKNSIEPPVSLVEGLLGTQTFADRVNSMIAQVEGESTGSGTFEVAERVEFGHTVKQDQVKEYNLILENDIAIVDPVYPVDQDPFYENDCTVIAAFLLDQNIFDKPMLYSCIMLPVLWHYLLPSSFWVCMYMWKL